MISTNMSINKQFGFNLLFHFYQVCDQQNIINIASGKTTLYPLSFTLQLYMHTSFCTITQQVIILKLMQRGFLNKTKPRQDTVANKCVKVDEKERGHNVKGTFYIGSKQIDNDNESNCKSIHSKQTKIQSKQKMSTWQKRFYLNQILQFIFDVADRNQVYRSNFIHAHIPFAIIFKILDIETHTSHHTYLKEVINVLITKIKRQNLKAQLEKESHFQQFMVVVSNPQPNEEELLSFLRKFIVENKETMQGFLPYYYNYFALVVNKQIVFNKKDGELIEYTIDYKHKQPYKQVFSEKDISDILEEFEKKLVQKYHSDDI